MRCSCAVCDTYMVHSEGLELGCVCPACGNRCKACLGTNTVVSRENLKNLAIDFETRFALTNDRVEDAGFSGDEKDMYSD